MRRATTVPKSQAQVAGTGTLDGTTPPVRWPDMIVFDAAKFKRGRRLKQSHLRFSQPGGVTLVLAL
jgi:hypothetical protein